MEDEHREVLAPPEPVTGQRGPWAVGGEHEKPAEVAAALGRAAQVGEHTGHVPVGVGVVRLLPQHTLKRRQGEFSLAEFGQHAALAIEVAEPEFPIDRECGPDVTRQPAAGLQHRLQHLIWVVVWVAAWIWVACWVEWVLHLLLLWLLLFLK